VWKRCGYDVTIFEASDKLGGQWNTSYDGVSVQNTKEQYHFAGFPVPFETKNDRLTGEEVLRYVQLFQESRGLEVRFNMPVVHMIKENRGWTLEFEDGSKRQFAYVVIATGLYPGGDAKHLPNFAGLGSYRGQILKNVTDASVFDGKRVAVVGFGKTALDCCVMAASRGSETTHVFRKLRWTVPMNLFGICTTRFLLARFGTEMVPSWHHPNLFQRLLHGPLAFLVTLHWIMLANVLKKQFTRDADIREANQQKALDEVIPPPTQLVSDLRSAAAMASPGYHKYVAHGRIRPVRSEVAGFYEDGLILASGERVEADVVCICCGNAAPKYPFLPEEYRGYVETDQSPNLYRFAVEPRIPDLGFAIANCLQHMAVAHMNALWQVAVYRGDLVLPSVEGMLRETAQVRTWKLNRYDAEPTLNVAIDARCQQVLDMYCNDLGQTPYRKLPNVAAEIFDRYGPDDYDACVDAFLASTARGPRVVGELTCCASVRPID